jgi:hypothetical protein
LEQRPAAKKKGGRKPPPWLTIAAGDEILNDPMRLAYTFLQGVDEDGDGVSVPHFRYLEPGSPEETLARQALIYVLSNWRQPLHSGIRSTLAGLFDYESKWPFARRKLVFEARGKTKQPDRYRDLCIATFIGMRLEQGDELKNAVKDAAEHFGGGRAHGYRVWAKQGEEATNSLKKPMK